MKRLKKSFPFLFIKKNLERERRTKSEHPDCLRVKGSIGCDLFCILPSGTMKAPVLTPLKYQRILNDFSDADKNLAG